MEYSISKRICVTVCLVCVANCLEQIFLLLFGRLYNVCHVGAGQFGHFSHVILIHPQQKQKNPSRLWTLEVKPHLAYILLI